MNKKRVLFLEQYSKISGAQKVLLSLITGLRDYYDFSVIVPEKGELTRELVRLKTEYTIFPIGYYSLGEKTFFDIFNYLFRLLYLIQRLVHIIKEKNIDLVYANGARTFVWGTIACGITNVPIIWHLHSIFSKGLIRKLCLFFGKKNIVKKIIVVSQAVKNPFGALAEKIEVIYNAIDTEAYFPKKTGHSPLREQLKIGNGFLIGMAGLLIEWKGIDDLIRAAKIIIHTYPQSRFVIVGDVLYDKKGQRYKEYLMNLINESDLNDNVLFTGYRKDIPEIMRDLDIFVLASKKPDPCPTSLLQAMASGVAVIATNSGGPAEIIYNGEDGLLYTPSNYIELAEKILFLLNNPKIREVISCNATKKIEQNFRQINYFKKIREIIDTALLK